MNRTKYETLTIEKLLNYSIAEMLSLVQQSSDTLI